MDAPQGLDWSNVGVTLGLIAGGLIALVRILRSDTVYRRLLEDSNKDRDAERKRNESLEDEIAHIRRESEKELDRLRGKVRLLQAEVDKTYDDLRRVRELEAQVRSLEADLEVSELDKERIVAELVACKGALAARFDEFPKPIIETPQENDEGSTT